MKHKLIQGPAGLEEVLTKQKRKPPLGLTPRFIRETERMRDIHGAIHRYLYESEQPKQIPQAWLDEFNELNKRLKP